MNLSSDAEQLVMALALSDAPSLCAWGSIYRCLPPAGWLLDSMLNGQKFFNCPYQPQIKLLIAQ